MGNADMARPRRAAGVTADRLFEISNAFFAPKALLCASGLGVFDALDGGPLDAPSLAAKLGTEPRATRILLDALAAIDVVEPGADGRYANGPEASRYLVGGRETSIAAYLELADRTFSLFAKLGDAVRTGRPQRPPDMFQGDAEAHRTFILGMHATASANAPALAAGLPIDGEAHLLDVGCGPGTYAMEYCRCNPRLRATLFDFESTLAIARDLVDAAGLADRIDCRPGDFATDDLGGPYDWALVSHIVHGHSEAAVKALLSKVAAALRPGGRIVVHDFLLAGDRTRPTYAALFSLNMLLHTDGGRSISFAECAAWLEDAGFAGAEWLDLGEPRSITVAVATRR